MYKFVENIDKKEYDKFVENHTMTSFMQEYNWCNVKDNWKSFHVGLYKNNNLIGVSSILVRSFKGIKLFYIPRGYLIDFEVLDDLKEMTDNIKRLAKKEKAFLVKIDPNFCSNQYSLKNEEINTPYCNNYKLKEENLKKVGFKHKPNALELGKNFQPQYNVFAPTCDKNLNILTKDELLKTYKSKFRYYLGDYHTKRGVSFEITDDINKLDDFITLLRETEKKQNINLRNKSYFEKLMKNFENRAYFVFGKVDLTKYLEFLKNNNCKEEEIIEVQDLLNESNELLLSVGLLILPSNKKGIRTSEYLYAGNSPLLKKLSVSSGVVFELINYSLENNCHYCNLGGVNGNLNDHLFVFKSKFNSQVLEFTGEYDLIINKPLYFAYNTLLPLIKKMIKR